MKFEIHYNNDNRNKLIRWNQIKLLLVLLLLLNTHVSSFFDAILLLLILRLLAFIARCQATLLQRYYMQSAQIGIGYWIDVLEIHIISLTIHR